MQPFQEDLLVQRTVITDVVPVSNQTPVFIGTAHQLVTITTTDGSDSIPIVNPQDGVRLDTALTEATVQYWKIAGIYKVTSVDDSLTKLTCITSLQNEQINLDASKYSCFVVDIISNNVIFSSDVFEILIGNDNNINGLILKKPLDSITIDDISYKIYLSYIDTYNSNSNDFISIDSVLSLTSTQLKVMKQNNLQGLISITWKLYFLAIDYRTLTLLPDMEIPPEFVTNKNNQLGQAVAYHRAISPTLVTLLTIPEQTNAAVKNALNIYSSDSTLDGYVVVNLAVNYMVLFPPPIHIKLRG